MLISQCVNEGIVDDGKRQRQTEMNPEEMFVSISQKQRKPQARRLEEVPETINQNEFSINLSTKDIYLNPRSPFQNVTLDYSISEATCPSKKEIKVLLQLDSFEYAQKYFEMFSTTAEEPFCSNSIRFNFYSTEGTQLLLHLFHSFVGNQKPFTSQWSSPMARNTPSFTIQSQFPQ